jgi:hypothetical protein
LLEIVDLICYLLKTLFLKDNKVFSSLLHFFAILRFCNLLLLLHVSKMQKLAALQSEEEERAT